MKCIHLAGLFSRRNAFPVETISDICLHGIYDKVCNPIPNIYQLLYLIFFIVNFSLWITSFIQFPSFTLHTVTIYVISCKNNPARYSSLSNYSRFKGLLRKTNCPMYGGNKDMWFGYNLADVVLYFICGIRHMIYKKCTFIIRISKPYIFTVLCPEN